MLCYVAAAGIQTIHKLFTYLNIQNLCIYTFHTVLLFARKKGDGKKVCLHQISKVIEFEIFVEKTLEYQEDDTKNNDNNT